MNSFWKKFSVAVFLPIAISAFVWATFITDDVLQRGPASTGGVFGNIPCNLLFKGLTTKQGEDFLKQIWWFKKFDALGPDIIKRAKQAKRLPNNHIDISEAQLKRLRRKVPKKMMDKYMNLLELDRNPHMIMPGMEYGNLKNLGAKVQVGGEAVVINDNIRNFPKFIGDWANGKASYIFPGFGGPDSLKATGKGELFKTYSEKMGDRVFEVEVYRYKDADGAWLYSVEHPIFARRPARVYTGVMRPKWGGADNVYENGRLVLEEISANAYTSWPKKVEAFHRKIVDGLDPSLSKDARSDAIRAAWLKLSDNEIKDLWTVGPEELFSGRVEWEDWAFESLFNRVTVNVQKDIDANILHLQDYHTAMAGMIADKDTVVQLTIHNAGAAYQGRYYTVGFGDGYMKKLPEYDFEVPYAGDPETVESFKEMLSFADISFDTWVRDLMSPEGSGDVMSLNAINKIARDNLNGGSPVSEGYTQELRYTREIILEMIEKETGAPPAHKVNWWDLPNGGLEALTKNVLDGIVNGLDEGRHAMNSSMLKDVTEEQIINGRKVIKKWGDLRFGDELGNHVGRKKLRENKKIFKGITQRALGLIEDPTKPLFAMVSRFVDQKDPLVVIRNIKHIIENGGQVVISGEVGDEVGAVAAKMLKEMVEDPQYKGNLAFVEGRLQQFGEVMGGADFFFVPSKHEPCGITDIEAMWFGIIPIAKNIGGLNKGASTMLYNFIDAKNVDGHTYKLRTVINDAFDIYFNKPDEFEKLRIMGLEQRFPLETQYSRFLENYRSAALWKVFVEAKNESTSASEAVQMMGDVMESLPDDLIGNFIRLLRLKPVKDEFEEALLNSL